jgi:prolyl oligopeptidase
MRETGRPKRSTSNIGNLIDYGGAKEVGNLLNVLGHLNLFTFEGETDFEIITIDYEANRALTSFRSHSRQKCSERCSVGFKQRIVRIALNDDRLIVQELAALSVISPDTSALRKGRCTAKEGSKHLQRLVNPVFLRNRLIRSIFAWNKEHKQRRFRLDSAQRLSRISHIVDSNTFCPESQFSARGCEVFTMRLTLLLMVASLWPLDIATTAEKPAYPPSKTESVTDTLHGVKITDLYRWLEDGESLAVKEWTAKQNAFTRSWLDKQPGRAALRAKLDAMLDVGTISVAVPRGKRIFYTKREGKQNQPILYVVKDGKTTPLVDPNLLSKDGTVTLDWWFPSKDGKYVAYGLSSGGSELSTLHVRDAETGKDLNDKIEHARACSLAWTPDNKGFYYTRYPKLGDVPKGEERYHRHVFYHELGNDPAKDEKIFGKGRDPADWPNVTLSPDGRWLVVTVEKGWAMSEVYFKDLFKNDEPFKPLVEKVEARFSAVARNNYFYVLTNHKAPRYQLFAVTPQKPEREDWKLIIPEGKAVLEAAAPIGDKIVGHYLNMAVSQLTVFSRDGKAEQQIGLPLGSISGLAGESDGKELYFAYQSYTTPPSVYRLDLNSTKSNARNPAVWQSIQSDLKLSDVDVQQVRYPSKDGTQIPIFLIARKGLKKDGKTPTVLYGYGGFNISQTPTFNPTRFLTIVEYGGIMAVANLRGGSEFGEEWHQAGMLGKKQNVFGDFIAAAEYLIKEKHTDRDHLAIMGRSNGGLLVGAALTQRPDLFRAVVCGVPLLDMVRYHKFLIAKLWIPEYGSADEPDEFRFLHAYSPYHRVQDGIAYPAVLLATGEGDTRVDPLHARKMAARLQAATMSDHPILLRIEEKAGHGQGKPRSKLLDEQVDTWSFLLGELGVITR